MLTGALTFLQKPGFYQPKGDGAEWVLPAPVKMIQKGCF